MNAKVSANKDMGEAMKCKKCGARVINGNSLCEQCGAPIDNRIGSKYTSTKSRRKTRAIAITVIATFIIALLITMMALSHQKDVRYTQKLESGQKYLVEENYDAAIKSFDEAIAIKPQRADAYIEKANVIIRTGSPESAFVVLDDAKNRVDSEDRDIIVKRIAGMQKENPLLGLSDEIKTAYLKVLGENEANIRAYENSEIYDFQGTTAIYDINEDGIPELLFFGNKNGDDTIDFKLHIYTCENKNAHEIDYKEAFKIDSEPEYEGDLFGPIVVGGAEQGYIVLKEKGKKGLSFYRVGSGYEEYRMITDQVIMNDVLEVEKTDHFERGVYREYNSEAEALVGPMKNVCIENGKRISKESYDEKMTSILDNTENLLFIGHNEKPTYDKEIWNSAYKKKVMGMSYDNLINKLRGHTKKERKKDNKNTLEGLWYHVGEIPEEITLEFFSDGTFIKSDYNEDGSRNESEGEYELKDNDTVGMAFTDEFGRSEGAFEYEIIKYGNGRALLYIPRTESGEEMYREIVYCDNEDDAIRAMDEIRE